MVRSAMVAVLSWLFKIVAWLRGVHLVKLRPHQAHPGYPDGLRLGVADEGFTPCELMRYDSLRVSRLGDPNLTDHMYPPLPNRSYY